MKFIKLKQSPFEIEISLNFSDFMSNADIDEKSVLHSSFSLAVKHQFSLFLKFHYPEAELKFSSHPIIKIQGNDNDCLNYIFEVLNKLNEQSKEIIADIYKKRQLFSFDDLKLQFDQNINQQIRNKNQKQNLQFLEIKQNDLEINVKFELNELSHLNMLQSLEYINVTRDAIKEQFEIYNKSYCPDENISIHTQPDLVITGNNKKTIDYLVNILNRVNNQSNYIYEQVLNDRKGNLKEEFSFYFNSFIAQEILSDYLPNTSQINKKKNKV